MLDAGFCNLKQTRGHEPEFELAALSPRRTCRPLRVGRLFPFGRPTRESHVDLRRRPGRASRRVVITSLRVVAFRGRAGSFEPVRPCHGAEAPAFAGALRTSTEPATLSSRSARFRVFEARSRTTRNDFMTSDVGRGLRVKDRSAPTPQGSGARRVPLLAGGPEHPLSSPRVRPWLESRVRLGDANPERPRSSFAPPPAKEEAFPKTRVLGTAP